MKYPKLTFCASFGYFMVHANLNRDYYQKWPGGAVSHNISTEVTGRRKCQAALRIGESGVEEWGAGQIWGVYWPFLIYV